MAKAGKKIPHRRRGKVAQRRRRETALKQVAAAPTYKTEQPDQTQRREKEAETLRKRIG